MVFHSAPYAVWFIFLCYASQPLGAGPGVMSEAQRRAFGGNGFFIFVPAEQLL